eukprot:31051-Pelagococcus_subviridis.AAC.3
MRRQKSLRDGVHHADAVVWGPVYRTHLSAVPRRGRVDAPAAVSRARGRRVLSRRARDDGRREHRVHVPPRRRVLSALPRRQRRRQRPAAMMHDVIARVQLARVLALSRRARRRGVPPAAARALPAVVDGRREAHRLAEVSARRVRAVAAPGSAAVRAAPVPAPRVVRRRAVAAAAVAGDAGDDTGEGDAGDDGVGSRAAAAAARVVMVATASAVVMGVMPGAHRVMTALRGGPAVVVVVVVVVMAVSVVQLVAFALARGPASLADVAEARSRGEALQRAAADARVAVPAAAEFAAAAHARPAALLAPALVVAVVVAVQGSRLASAVDAVGTPVARRVRRRRRGRRPHGAPRCIRSHARVDGDRRRLLRLVARARAVRDAPAAEAPQRPALGVRRQLAVALRARGAAVRRPWDGERPGTRDVLGHLRALAVAPDAVERAVEGRHATPGRPGAIAVAGAIAIRAVAALASDAAADAVRPRLGARGERLAPHLRDELLEKRRAAVDAGREDRPLLPRRAQRLGRLAHEKHRATQRRVFSGDLHRVSDRLRRVVHARLTALLVRYPEQTRAADGAEGRGSIRSEVGVELKGVNGGVERRRGVSGLRARGDGRRESRAGRESPQGAAYTMRTRSYGDQCEIERTGRPARATRGAP